MNFVKSINMNSARAIQNFAGQYQPMQLCLGAGFSSPAQACFFFICAGDSASVGYCPCTLPRPGTTNENFQQSGKQDSFRNILKSSARIYESSG